MRPPPERLAIFDLDYTLTRKGTWGRFTVRCMRGRAWRWPELLARAGGTQLLYKFGMLPRIAVKTQMMRVCMVGRTRAELTAIADDFARNEVPDGLRAHAIPTILRHRAAGDDIVIASAAVDVLVAPIAARLGIETWVATRFAWDANDRLVDHFDSPNCYGSEKAAAICALYGDLKSCDTHITMYSDSIIADIDLFNLADDAVAVNPNSALRRMAEAKNWRIEDWNGD